MPDTCSLIKTFVKLLFFSIKLHQGCNILIHKSRIPPPPPKFKKGQGVGEKRTLFRIIRALFRFISTLFRFISILFRFERALLRFLKALLIFKRLSSKHSNESLFVMQKIILIQKTVQGPFSSFLTDLQKECNFFKPKSR